MNTSQIKNFAIASRNLLKAGVIQRFQVLGFDADGNLTKGMPTRIQGGATLFAGQFLSEDFYDKWTSLYEHVQQVGVKEVYEEAAYTWFNRLVAIRIMQKNHFIDPVLAYTNEEARLPRIVAEARAGHIATEMLPADRARLQELLGDDSKLNEQFALLIENYCRYNPVIYNCFGGIEQYISLLLPDNILAPGGFIDLLNHTSYITDDDYKQSELIGWLYQFYISERKDEVFDKFKKGKKADAEDIPAATQIFTPNWIVKYMVENTLGRIYLDNNPYSEIKTEMKYLVEPAEPTLKEAILKIDNLEDFKLMDNACGSGHILVEGFDLFYKMYLEEAFSSRVAIESIFRKNLIGIDIDTRAKQLATFALLMRAAHIDPSFLDCRVMPRVLDMPGTSFSRPLTELLREFFMSDDRTLIQETYEAFELLKQAHILGSIMKFNLSNRTRKEMALRYQEWTNTISAQTPKNSVHEILPSVQLILALSDSYSAVATNPPYLESGNMNAVLANYVRDNYQLGKNDLFSVFMMLSSNLLTPHGKYGMINMDTWTFKSSFESFRSDVIRNCAIDSYMMLGTRTFEELSGEVVQNVAFVISNHQPTTAGKYFNLSEESSSERKKSLFESQSNFQIIHQNDFLNISGHVVCIISDQMLHILENSDSLSSIGVSKQGLATGSNDLFVREWHEVNFKKIGLNVSSTEDSLRSRKKWFPYNKGGSRRRWYGNQSLVVNWLDDGESIKHFTDENGKLRSRPQNTPYYFKPSISWGLISGPYFRYFQQGFIYDIQGMSFFPSEDIYSAISWMNSKVFRSIGKCINPREQYQAGDLLKLPAPDNNCIRIGQKCIELSKEDYDAHEISWDFKENELVRIYKENHGEGLFFDANRLSDIFTLYKEYWTEQFNALHNNEEELNRQFIDIYSLQEELTPEVSPEEVTILQQGEITVEDGQLVWHDDVLVKQLISYAIGCMMGRYRLDRPGLHIAYPNPSPADVEAYEFQGEEFEIDDDGIIPLLGRDCAFEDNAYNRVVKFLSQVFGDSFLNENLNFIESALGKSVEDYLVKDFWKDHKKMYSNRPIYWLFSSKKGAFQCLAYMHRMNPYTAELVRSKYLLPYIDYLKGKIAEDTAKAASLSTVERRNLDKMQVALTECLEYEERLHNVADSQIGFDLDDGVVVNYAKYGDILAKIK